MSVYQQLVANVLFPLHEKLKGHDTVAVHRALNTSQWLPQDEVLALQLENLQRFLSRIGRTVPYLSLIHI